MFKIIIIIIEKNTPEVVKDIKMQIQKTKFYNNTQKLKE